MQNRTQNPNPNNYFAFLSQIDRDTLIRELCQENIRTIAVIFNQIDRIFSAKLLASLPTVLQRQVISAMKNTKKIDSSLLQDIAATLRKRIYHKQKPASAPGMVQYGGPEVAAAILRHATPETRKLLAASEPNLFSNLTRLMFSFADFQNVPAKSLQTIFASIETKTLALALKVAMPELRKCILNNLSNRRQDIVLDEMERQERVEIADIEEAQQNIVNLALEMQKNGKIILNLDEQIV